jgi:hypothetical protein
MLAIPPIPVALIPASDLHRNEDNDVEEENDDALGKDDCENFHTVLLK